MSIKSLAISALASLKNFSSEEPSRKRRKTDEIFPDLPSEIWLKIFSYFNDRHDLGTSSLLNRHFYQIASDNQLWKPHFEKTMGYFETQNRAPFIQNWKESLVLEKKINHLMKINKPTMSRKMKLENVGRWNQSNVLFIGTHLIKTEKNQLIVFDLRQKKKEEVLKPFIKDHFGNIQKVQKFSQTHIATITDGIDFPKELKVWDLKEEEPSCLYTRLLEGIEGLFFGFASLAEHQFISKSANGELIIWDGLTQEAIEKYQLPEGFKKFNILDCDESHILFSLQQDVNFEWKSSLIGPILLERSKDPSQSLQLFFIGNHFFPYNNDAKMNYLDNPYFRMGPANLYCMHRDRLYSLEGLGGCLKILDKKKKVQVSRKSDKLYFLPSEESKVHLKMNDDSRFYFSTPNAFLVVSLKENGQTIDIQKNSHTNKKEEQILQATSDIVVTKYQHQRNNTYNIHIRDPNTGSIISNLNRKNTHAILYHHPQMAMLSAPNQKHNTTSVLIQSYDPSKN